MIWLRSLSAYICNFWCIHIIEDVVQNHCKCYSYEISLYCSLSKDVHQWQKAIYQFYKDNLPFTTYPYDSYYHFYYFMFIIFFFLSYVIQSTLARIRLIKAQPIPPELAAKLLGNRVAVSPIVTVEPRRRKFHKPISLTIPVPTAAGKGMINQYNNTDGTPTLRLLCSITGNLMFYNSSFLVLACNYSTILDIKIDSSTKMNFVI